MWGDYAVESICKQYIFHRAVLLNTEIIITITPRPLIKSSRTVRTYGRQFSQSQSERFCTKTQGLKCASIQKIFQTVKCGYKKQDFCMNLWRGYSHNDVENIATLIAPPLLKADKQAIHNC